MASTAASSPVVIFRLKASWRSALELQQQAAVAMAEWERNPPEEDKGLHGSCCSIASCSTRLA